MRKLDNNRIEEYLKKHVSLKKWVSIMLVVALLVTTVTMYSLNKSANALSDEDAEDVGMVLSGNDSDDLAAEGGDEGDTDSVQDSGDADSTDGESTDNADTDEGTSSDADVNEDGNSDVTSDEDTDSTDNSETESTDGTSEGENSDGTTDLADASDNQTTEDGENTDAPNSSEGLKDTNDVDLTQDVVLTVSYVTEDNEQIADEKEISLSESLDFETEAPKQEGYEFKQASIDETVISKIVAKQDANGYKYYEVNTADGTALTVKENKTVVLTYSHEIVVDGGVKLTAKYVDKDGAEIKEAEDFVIAEETDLKQGESTTLDGYFYLGATYNDQKITKITPVLEDSSEDSEKTEETEQAEGSEQTEGTENRENKVVVKEYKATVTDSEDITISEDSDIVFTYVKATTETSFSYSDDKVIVTAEATTEGVFPEGIELKVTEITAQTENYNYDAYLNALNDNAESIAKDAGKEESCQYSENNTILYDIAFIYDGKEIQPKEGSVNVSIEFKENQLSDSLSATQEDISVVHLPIKEEVKEANSIESTEEAKDITPEDIEVKTLPEATAEVGDDEKVEFSEDNFSIYAVIAYQNHTPGSDTFETILGDAVNFGIVADTLNIGESETNFAVKTVNAGAQFGNDLTNPAEQTFMAGVVNGDFKLKGYPAYFIVPVEYASLIKHTQMAYLKLDTAYSSSEINKVIDDMKEYVSKASEDLAQRKDNASIAYDEKSQKYSVDITKYAAGTYYVTLNDDYMTKLAENGKLRIYKNSNQNIVFNVTASGSVSLQQYLVSTNGGDLVDCATIANSSAYASVTKSIIWNFINASEVKSSGSVSGVFISHNTSAAWVNESTSSGWLYFPTTTITSGEWHNTYDQVKQISGTVQFQAYKNIDGNPANVSGFEFTVKKQESSGAWTEIQTVKNDEESPHNVIFDSITFGNDASKANNNNYQYVSINEVGGTQDFIFVIDETKGTTDTAGNSYTEDSSYYFAKVTVTLCKLNTITSTTYYQVSAPKYYKDYACTQAIDTELPTFNNTTTQGNVGIALYKYLNNGDPGEHKFTFTVRALKSDGSLETLTNNLTNSGKNISYSFDYNNNFITTDSQGNKRIYLVITENDIVASNSGVSKDGDYIIARIDHPGETNQKIYYFKYDDKTEADYIAKIESNDINKIKEGVASDKTKKSENKIGSTDQIAFYNNGESNLRIHKIVVNDFGSAMVRDGTKASQNSDDSILKKVMFRITDNASGNYIVFQGFVGNAGTKGRAIEYPSNKTYEVVYNGSAQWTVVNLPSGTYTVDEVADGVTFEYNAKTNTSSAIDSAFSRVTMYAVTTDTEELKDGAPISTYGTGGENYRKVFSYEIDGLSEKAPTNVRVGSADVANTSHTETVQVCNYYSNPLGPIQITKNFTNGTWSSDMSFTFTMEAAGYLANTSEGDGVKLLSQPMPANNTVTLTGADAKKDENGNYTAIASFDSIPYKYEGTYYYKITETKGDNENIHYDKTVYYVKIEVKKKDTTFAKSYSYGNMTHPNYELYDEKGTVKSADLSYDGGVYTYGVEKFYYLGADVTYSDDENYANILATCELYLGKDPKTNKPIKEFQSNYTLGDVSTIAFNNYFTGYLKVTKKWQAEDGSDNKDRHSIPIKLYIFQSTDGSNWTVYGDPIEISADTDWSATVTELPLKDENGKQYQYCVKEDSKDNETFQVSYTYDGKTQTVIGWDAINSTTVTSKDGKNTNEYKYIDANYSMSVDENSIDYGEVTITNRSISTNVLPASGGMGTLPFTLAGALMAIVALGALLFGRKKKD